MDKIDEIFTENGMKRPENLFYFLLGDPFIVSLDCKYWYKPKFNDGLADVVPVYHNGAPPYELGVALGFYDTHTPIMP